MKKVSFKEGLSYTLLQVNFLPPYELGRYFLYDESWINHVKCTESFTCEITVKIVPYEQQ